MTSDAKVGLLLGLVFIFLIAFLINGLPSFKGHKGNNDLTVNSLGSKNNSLGIAENERKVSRQFIEQDIRLNAPLPQTSSVSKTSIEGRPAVGAVPASDESLVQSLREVAGKLESTVVENPAVRTIKTSAGHVLPLPKSYIVSEGDNLAIIAQKVYGPVEGKRKANIERIFKANTAILQSPDEIYVGQKLVIPPLLASETNTRIDSESSTSVAAFDKLKTVSSNVIADDNKQSNVYIVKQGDSLWTIAEKKLGNGSRYTEIIRLNADILEDEDSLAVGMRLKLPAR